VHPKDLKYTKDHEWIRVEGGGKGRIGITDYAQDHLGDIVFVELPEVGTSLKQKEVFATVESVKAVSDCYAPAGGKVVEVNEKLVDEPALLNSDPYGDGWIAVLEIENESDLDSLMDPDEYEKYCEEAGDAH